MITQKLVLLSSQIVTWDPNTVASMEYMEYNSDKSK